jgi:hypothetical protein
VHGQQYKVGLCAWHVFLLCFEVEHDQQYKVGLRVWHVLSCTTSKHNKRHIRHTNLMYIAGHAPLQNIIKDISDTQFEMSFVICWSDAWPAIKSRSTCLTCLLLCFEVVHDQQYKVGLRVWHVFCYSLKWCMSTTSKHNKRHVRHVDLLYIAGHAPLQRITKDMSDT